MVATDDRTRIGIGVVSFTRTWGEVTLRRRSHPPAGRGGEEWERVGVVAHIG